MKEKKITEIVADLMLDKKALDIKIIKVDKLTTLTDYFINCSTESDPQTRAIKNHIHDTLSSQYDLKPQHIEGFENLQWILMDYSTVVINIFNKETREYYDIERLWADAEIKTVEK
tara:strand:+ start:65 stop:412 length:348 start_codon:yes stop_codon:yes gene_type:complete